MKSFTLDGSAIRTEADFHGRIQDLLGFFVGYGWNLQALLDVLHDRTGLMKETPPIEVVWTHSGVSARALGPVFEEIVGIFETSPVRLRLE